MREYVSMLFFNKKEQAYFDDFIERHRQFNQSYFSLVKSFEHSYNHISHDVTRLGYFLWQGILDLSNALYSLCKSLCHLCFFSFSDSWQSSKDSVYFASAWVTKHAFALVSSFLTLIQLTTKLFSWCFTALEATVPSFAKACFMKPHYHSKKSKQLGYEMDEFCEVLEKSLNDRKEIEEQISYFFKLLDKKKFSNTPGDYYFKAGTKQQAIEMHQQLMEIRRMLTQQLLTYPSCERLGDVIDPGEFSHMRIRLVEHHTLACQLATVYFQAFSDYLRYTDNSVSAINDGFDQESLRFN